LGGVESEPAAPVTLDVFADIACPWCLIGRRRLQRALEAEAPGSVLVRHRAFQLQPDLPPQGEPMRAFFAAKFGSWERAEAMFARVREEGAGEGIAFAFEAMPKAPNTVLAHRAVALAGEQGAQDAALEALYLATFTEGLDITDPAVVTARLARAGVPDPAALRAGLDAGAGLDAVAADLRLASQLGVTAVPLFVADERWAVPGAQAPEVLRGLVDHARLQRGADGGA
jgi:predicted DsbA family dithiol-disulfide isomerase